MHCEKQTGRAGKEFFLFQSLSFFVSFYLYCLIMCNAFVRTLSIILSFIVLLHSYQVLNQFFGKIGENIYQVLEQILIIVFK